MLTRHITNSSNKFIIMHRQGKIVFIYLWAPFAIKCETCMSVAHAKRVALHLSLYKAYYTRCFDRIWIFVLLADGYGRNAYLDFWSWVVTEEFESERVFVSNVLVHVESTENSKVKLEQYLSEENSVPFCQWKMNYKVLSILVILSSFQMISVFALPNPFFGWSRSPEGGRPASRGRSYNDIARVINPSPYAFPGRSPFPAQPFWTYG